MEYEKVLDMFYHVSYCIKLYSVLCCFAPRKLGNITDNHFSTCKSSSIEAKRKRNKQKVRAEEEKTNKHHEQPYPSRKCLFSN